MARIELTGKYAEGRVALVDDADLPLLAGWSWWCTPGGYATTHMRINGVRHPMFMHRWLLNLPVGASIQVDHRNHDRLDNRRANLRVGDAFLNNGNTSSQAGSSSRFRGVYWDARKTRWRARVMIRGSKRSLGYYDSEEAAHDAVCAALGYVYWPPRQRQPTWIPAEEFPEAEKAA